ALRALSARRRRHAAGEPPPAARRRRLVRSAHRQPPASGRRARGPQCGVEILTTARSASRPNESLLKEIAEPGTEGFPCPPAFADRIPVVGAGAKGCSLRCCSPAHREPPSSTCPTAAPAAPTRSGWKAAASHETVRTTPTSRRALCPTVTQESAWR